MILTFKQQFIILMIVIICLTLIVITVLLTQTNAIMTFHFTSDNNTLEIFRTINWSVVSK